MAFENIIMETRGAVGIIQFNRPRAMNALSRATVTEIAAAIAQFEADDSIGCIILTGGDKAFAAGADIKEMQNRSFPETYLGPFLKEWEGIAQRRKPMIAAVAGVALGGGCELAMMCDFIIAADTAKFGQPEITVGVIPGAGGTQRLARFIGKAKAMDMILTGRLMDAAEAERCGLASRIVAAEKLMVEAVAAAEKIASFSRPAILMAREAVDRAFETPLAEGLRFERRVFEATFALADQKEGMAAFTEKRQARFQNR